MTETPLQRPAGESFLKTDAGMPNGGEHQELGRLLQRATRLVEKADLTGANETLEAAEKALIVRSGIFDLGSR